MVGWWLIPFANFVKPFGAVRELWKASAGVEQWWESKSPYVIGLWWTMLLCANVFGPVAGAFFRDRSPTVDSPISGDRWTIATQVLLVLAAILAIMIVRVVVARQARLVNLVAERTPVPARPDVPGGWT